MKFTVTQVVEVPPAQAVAVYGSPGFYENRPARDDVSILGVVGHREEGASILLEVRYAFTAPVSAAVRAVIDPDRMTWVTRSTIWPPELRTEWVVVPDHYPDRLRANGSYRFEAAGTGTRVDVEGDLTVRVPLVARSVERVIVSGLRSYIDDEVASLTRTP